MKIEKLITDDRSLILERLKGQVFHLTTINAYDEIKISGEISNNQTGTFPINTGSQHSYGRLHGCVCLFDLRHNDPEIIEKTLNCYYFLGPTWFSKHGRKYNSWDLAYLMLDQRHYDKIIPNSRVHDHYHDTGDYLQAIPTSEVWINTKVPLTWINKILFARIREPIPDRNTIEGIHYWAVYNTWDKK